MVTTGYDFPGYTIEKSLGLVIGNSSTLEVSLVGKNVQYLLQKALNEAEMNLIASAKNVGGNAVIGCRTEVIRPPVSVGPSLIHFILTGTAVVATPVSSEKASHNSNTISANSANGSEDNHEVKPILVDLSSGKCTCPQCGCRQNLGYNCIQCGVPFAQL